MSVDIYKSIVYIYITNGIQFHSIFKHFILHPFVVLVINQPLLQSSFSLQLVWKMEKEDGRKLWMLLALWLYNIQLYLSLSTYMYIYTNKETRQLCISTGKGPPSFSYLTVYSITIIIITQQSIYYFHYASFTPTQKRWVEKIKAYTPYIHIVV